MSPSLVLSGEKISSFRRAEEESVIACAEMRVKRHREIEESIDREPQSSSTDLTYYSRPRTDDARCVLTQMDDTNNRGKNKEKGKSNASRCIKYRLQPRFSSRRRGRGRREV